PRDCSCQLADSCRAVFGFTLGGGGRVAFGDQIYGYPATRVTLDACLEAAPDPLGKRACRDPDAGTYGAGYEIDQPPRHRRPAA
ncbi:hypothetical protein ACI4B7_28090, partial [Klebsiella pneumoniae]|uniref:hypothetical protein n=1 Tax=Klebsiella pneumoniae TaxID=573 RepID=UPI0038520316